MSQVDYIVHASIIICLTDDGPNVKALSVSTKNDTVSEQRKLGSIFWSSVFVSVKWSGINLISSTFYFETPAGPVVMVAGRNQKASTTSKQSQSCVKVPHFISSKTKKTPKLAWKTQKLPWKTQKLPKPPLKLLRKHRKLPKKPQKPLK